MPSNTPGQVVEQVWFSGVHCDVGGGNAQHGLSDITPAWMAGKAGEHGLAVDSATMKQGHWDQRFSGEGLDPDPLAPAGSSFTGFYRVTRPWRRPIGKVSSAESAASSAKLRRDEDPHYREPDLDH